MKPRCDVVFAASVAVQVNSVMRSAYAISIATPNLPIEAITPPTTALLVAKNFTNQIAHHTIPPLFPTGAPIAPLSVQDFPAQSDETGCLASVACNNILAVVSALFGLQRFSNALIPLGLFSPWFTFDTAESLAFNWIENPRVGGSNPPSGTTFEKWFTSG